MIARNLVIKSVDSLEQTALLARNLAPVLRAGDVVTLKGDLGAGKTAFARALINAFSSSPQEVPSPTFTLVQVYDLDDFSIWHFDLYRLETARDVEELGWFEALSSGVCLVEWADRLGGLLPPDRLEIEITFDPENSNGRKFAFIPHGKWQERLLMKGDQ